MTTAYFMGDSFLGTGFASPCASRLGWTPTIDGVGGSGYINPGSGSNFQTRLAALIAAHPDVAVIEGGGNDNSYGQSVFTSAVDTFYATLRGSLPTTAVYVVGTHRDDPAYTASVLSAAATKYSARFISWKPWLTGTYNTDGKGYVGASNGSGNTDIYISADGVHPTAAGAAYLGTRMAFAISAPSTGLA